MTSLTDFLLQRIAEDEAAAREFDTELAKEFGTTESRLSSEITLGATGYMEYPALLIDSTRVLAECEAKRRIVGLSWHHLGEDDYGWGMEEAKRQILAILALSYADHPDYREEWKP